MDKEKWVVNVNWDAVKYAESYTVYRSQYSDKDFTLIADNITGTNWQDPSPLLGDNYYRIYANGHGLTSQASVTSNLVNRYNPCPDNNHPHVIDMGEAGKWACCNVGASAPWEYGGYYAWGDTEEKSVYDWDHYKFYYSLFNTIGNNFSGSANDVAHVKWGGNWCMPRHSQTKLLITKCISQWTTLNGINGILLTATNGGTIFLPAAGKRKNKDKSFVGEKGYYWSCTWWEEDSESYAYYIYFTSDATSYLNHTNRCDGHSVRPVTE